MWFKGIIVAALTASLTVGPFASRVANADPPEAVNWEKVASELGGVAGMEDFGILVSDAQAEVVQAIESRMSDTSCTTCSLRDLGLAMEDLSHAVLGRPRAVGEFAFSIGTELQLAQAVTGSTKFGESIQVTKISTIEYHDLETPATRDYFNALNYHVITAQYGSIERAVVLISGDSGSRVVDAVIFGPKLDQVGAGVMLIPLSSAAAGSGSPPTISTALGWGQWGCAFTGLAFAFTLASCFGGIGGCAYGCIPCCIHGAGGCCAAWTLGMGYYEFCYGGSPSTVLGAVDQIINDACFFIPYP